MNIAIIGYGRMGHEVEEAALARRHKIILLVDKDNTYDLSSEKLKGVDVAIEFTTPDNAFQNISTCLGFKVPVVSGTTGWLKDYERVVELCKANDTSFIHSSNFSIGVNLLFRLNSDLAKQLAHYRNYKVKVEEIHHIRKLDAPSGTALTISESIAEKHPDYNGWCFDEDNIIDKVPIRSVREGNIPGTHTVTWDSEVDTITLRHESKNRKGLAMGALHAAEFIEKRKGVFTMDDILGF